jgi:hypothetical protein
MLFKITVRCKIFSANLVFLIFFNNLFQIYLKTNKTTPAKPFDNAGLYIKGLPPLLNSF